MDCSILLFVPLLVGRLAASESLFSPRELHCVFFAYANVSCYWKPGVKTPLVINYTLQVNLTGLKSELCHSPHTHCSVQVGSLNRPYCIRVLAHISQQETASSDTLCLNGIDAAQLPAPHSFWMSPNRPRCMRLRWSAPKNFPLTNQSIRNGYLLYELQYTTPHQPAPRSLALDLREEVHCVFSPCTPYRARIRLRYNHALSHWSGWSQSSTQRTSAEAPSSTPQLWRAIQMPDMKGFRPVTLLWKAPLTQAQCAALWYTVHCKLEDPNAAVDIGDCTDLGPANTSCHFTVPAQTCICSLSMSNSAGSSPSAIITIPSQWETEPRLLDTVQVTPLGGFRLKVRWTVLESFTLTGFVVEWCITTENTHCQGAPQWQRVEQTTNGTIIIEGVQANMCYSVSVKAQRGNRSGPGLTALAYSHQAAPSVGPKLHVSEHGCSYVVLRWSPVPLPLRNGFITKYTLHYQSEDNSTRQLQFSADSQQYRFAGVSGRCWMYVQAHTDAGGGPNGPVLSLFIDPCTSELPLVLFGCMFMAGFSAALCICWRMRQRMKQHFWPVIPSPAHSSLSKWL
ncbi:interleukin-6 receptor subunit beta-like isoform X2 [Brachyhypopomus gauderio]|uniref:interleukin-6 receptor subunit beta-like isoform X2 n=1 Tax=Brachyhypopomus gauderio TaxID=698409 RepID=UPI004042D3C9